VTAAWPGTLPDTALMEGLIYAPMDQSVSTQMETGPPKRRRRFSTDVIPVQVPLILTGTELTAFLAFYNTTLDGGSAPFTWKDPRLDTTVTFQFTAAPAWRPLRAHGTPASRLWAGELSLVRLA
jgi:hypothetical protein